jgi:preprotein translocase subunit SecA
MSVYESNVTLASSFKGRVYGVTGTLGNTGTRSLLEDIASVQTFSLPRLRKSQLRELKETIVKDKDTWKEKIAESIRSRKEEQPILVIVEEMGTVKELSDYLTSKGLIPTLSIDTNEKMEQCAKRLERATTGNLFIATNIAGRGTDIQFDKESFPEESKQSVVQEDKECEEAVNK